ncbi:MAG TPA: hypothetical protein VLO11_05155, partial [Luteolibacter sp.]|nr:hypothetical protein [Luteolibacter sp.]
MSELIETAPIAARERAGAVSRSFGNLPDGREVRIFTLRNRNGLEARVSDYGATLISMKAPDRHGVLADVTLGFDTFAGWLANGPYFGATIGRFG